MIANRILTAVFVACCMTFCCMAIAREAWEGVHRIVAIGDLHGDYARFIDVMEMAGLIDEDGDWSGGSTHLVQTGDIPDRGPDSLKIIRHFNTLERQARRAGGFIHLLIGNHEAMNIYGDLRYVHAGEYQVLVDSRSKRRQEQYYRRFIAHLVENNPDMTFDEAFRERWLENYPLGYVEHRIKWQPGGEIADWVLDHNTVIRINDILFVHGGIDPHGPYVSLNAINRQIRRELGALPLAQDALVQSPNGPLWYRGLLRNPAGTEKPAIERMLAHYGAEHIVVGHTTSKGVIRPRFGNRVIAIDVGLSRAYGAGLACLIIEGDNFYALHQGHRVSIPQVDDGVLPYFREILKIDPRPAVQAIIRDLEAPEAAPGQPEEEVPAP